MTLTSKATAVGAMNYSGASHFRVAQGWEMLQSACTGIHPTLRLNSDSETHEREQCLFADNKTSNVTVCPTSQQREDKVTLHRERARKKRRHCLYTSDMVFRAILRP